MDANECNPNHLDADVRLPPRKRLLAGLKKQSCSESTSPCSQENNPSPSLSPSLSLSHSPNPSTSYSATPLSEYDIRLKNLLKSYKNGSNMSPEEIANAAGLAAEAATKAAEVARAEAEEKAAIAVKAVYDAKNALNLVATISNPVISKDNKQLKKNKLKKHVPVQHLYNKYQKVENCGADEEVARNLHRAINSSPRITKHSPRSDSRNKHKKLKISPTSEKSDVANGMNVRNGNSKLPSACNGNVVIEEGMDCEGSTRDFFNVKLDHKVSKSPRSDSKNKHKKLKISPPSEKCGVANGMNVRNGKFRPPSTCNGNAVIEEGMDCEGSNEVPFIVRLDHKVSKLAKLDEVEVDNGEAESSHSKDTCINGRKRGRIKQKKLPLSICSSKDQSNPNEDQTLTKSNHNEDRNLTKSMLNRVRIDKPIPRHVSLLSMDHPNERVTPVEVRPTWKCQDFKVSPCLKQDKVVQS